MALIGEIRKRSGLLIITIGIAMLAFILSDSTFGGSPGSGQAAKVGEIDGSSIDAQAFQNKLRETEIQYQAYRQPITQEQLRNVAWSTLLREQILLKEIARVGIQVPDQEYEDLRWGVGAITEFRETEGYKDENGRFDPQRVKDLYNDLHTNNPAIWNYEKKRLTENRAIDKYNTLIKKGLYATTLEAQDNFNEQNASIDLSYVLKKYTDVNDSLITVSNGDLKDYYNDHKDDSEYKQLSASRSLDYIVIDSKPTAEDSALIRKDILSYLEEFKNAVNDSLFVTQNSDSRIYSEVIYKPEEEGASVDSAIINAKPGDIIGPYIEANKFKLGKVVGDVFEDQARVRHILLGNNNNTADMTKLKNRADSIIKVLKRKNNFDEMVEKFTDDPGSKENGGVYEWFDNKTMVPEFTKASFENKVGDIEAVETQFGIHIVEVLGQRKERQIKVVEFDKVIEPSSETRNEAYNIASRLTTTYSNADELRTAAEDEGLTISNAPNIAPGATNVGTVADARVIVLWAYNENTEVGDISEPYDVDDVFVIAILNKKLEKGIPDFENIKDALEVKVKQEKKASYLREQIKGYSTLQEIADVLGGTIQTASAVKVSSPVIPGAGLENEVIGTLFSSAEGTIWLIDGQNGVYAVQKDGMTGVATEGQDLSLNKSTRKTQLQSRATNEIPRALNEVFGVESNVDRLY